MFDERAITFLPEVNVRQMDKAIHAHLDDSLHPQLEAFLKPRLNQLIWFF
jgi:hypothetical protein